MNPQAPLITDEARAILDGAQHDCQIREVPSMTWGVMDRLEVEHPEVLEAEAATIGSADWRDNLKQAIDSPGWNSSWELHALISGAVASGRAQGVGCVGVGEVGRSAAALVGGEMRPVSDVDETAEAEPVQPGSFKVPSRFSGMIADPLSSTGSHRLEDVHEQLELMTRVEQALLRATSNKVVLVGDPQQLQSIEAGAAFRSSHDRHGGVEIHEVRRQREDWQRDATRDLATGQTANAIHAYDAHDMVHEAQSRTGA